MTDSKPFGGVRALITGGLGFIGSHLARRLLHLGADVTIVDSLIPEYGGNFFNIHDIRDRVSVNITDVRDSHAIEYLVQNKDLFSIWLARPVISIRCWIPRRTWTSTLARNCRFLRPAASTIAM